MPTYDALRQRLQSKVDPYSKYPKINKKEDLLIPDEFKFTCKNENFLIYDSGQDDNDRIIIFGTESNLNLLKLYLNWYVDGTFDVTPDIFYQLFTIHVLLKGKNLPCIYALLSNKSQLSYERLFLHLKNLINIVPISISSDFEQAILSATENIFDETVSHGCFFHFKQNLWRKIQNLGFQSDYNEKSDIRLFFKQLAALAFVPIVDLIYTYDLLRKDASNQAFFKLYNDFIKYFEATYIGELKRGKGVGRKDPRFKHEIWNVYTRNIEGLPRTNNNIEGWHYALQRVIKRSPSIYSFFDGIKLEQNNTETTYLQLTTGIVPKRRPVCIEIDKRISEIVSDYSKEKCLEYLKNIALIIDY